MIKQQQQKCNTEHSENLNEDDNSSINHPVPQFPEKKTPSYSEKSGKFSQQTSSTKDSYQNVGDLKILTLNNQFRAAQGNYKRELECQLIRRLSNMHKQYEGDCYMIDSQWATRYQQYLYENSNSLPGPIENSNLTKGQKMLQIGRDYIVVNDLIWKFLQEQYGGGPELICERMLQPQTPSDSTCQERAKSADISFASSFSQVKDLTIPLIGLKNELFYCYMNATLQCLMGIGELNDFFLNTLYQLICCRAVYDKMVICRLYQEMLFQLKNSQNEYVKLGGLRSVLSKRFNPKHQHDGQEFLLYLLSSMDEEISLMNKELQKTKKINLQNVIESNFKGQLYSEVICRSCKNRSGITEEFITLSLALISRINTINQGLEEFLREESIQDYHCEKCNKRRHAIKRTKLTKMPKYLMLHLKRFKYFPKSSKLTQHIKFPIEGVFNNAQYKLFGVIVHQGSLEQGHYYSYSKRGHKWYLFNDQKIKQVSKQDVIQQQAYILIYQQ